jgi:hypothetical protein
VRESIEIVLVKVSTSDRIVHKVPIAHVFFWWSLEGITQIAAALRARMSFGLEPLVSKYPCNVVGSDGIDLLRWRKASFWTLGRRMMIGTDYSTKFNTRRAQLTLWSRATTCELYGIVVDGFASRDFDQAGGCVEMLFRWRTSSAVDEGCTVDTFTHEIFGATELVLKK